MRQRWFYSFILCTAALMGCSGTNSAVPVNLHPEDGNAVTQDPNSFRLPAERIGARGADRVVDGQTLPDPEKDKESKDGGGGSTSTPTPTPAPAPTPDPEPAQEPAPEKTSTGQILNNVSTYCSDELVKYSEMSIPDVTNIKFHFFDQKRSNFLAYTVWDKNTDASSLKSHLKQKKAVLPAEFTGISDGIYDVLICNQTEAYCDFVKTFDSFSLYNSIMLGNAYGVVGIVHLHIASGKITSYDKAWFLYPTATTEVSCSHKS